MDPKLYKTLKQLVKLGIINNNTRIRQVRRKRRKRKANNSTSVLGGYAQPTDHLRTTVNYSSPSATIQTEQAMVNLKASEAQLERALNSKSLPYEYRDDVSSALIGIQKQLNTYQKDINTKYNNIYSKHNTLNDNFYNAYNQLDGMIGNKVQQAIKTINFSEDNPDIKAYNDMVPQTKLNSNMNTHQGINRDGQNINIINTTSDINDKGAKTSNDNIEEMKNQYAEDTNDKPVKISSRPIRIKKKIDIYSPSKQSTKTIRKSLIQLYAKRSGKSESEAKKLLTGKHDKTIQNMINDLPQSVEELEEELDNISKY